MSELEIIGALRVGTFDPEDGWTVNRDGRGLDEQWAFGALVDDAGERARYALRYEPEEPIDPREAWLAVGIGDWSTPESPAGRVAFGLRVFALRSGELTAGLQDQPVWENDALGMFRTRDAAIANDELGPLFRIINFIWDNDPRVPALRAWLAERPDA